jgi:hypothetical protein
MQLAGRLDVTIDEALQSSVGECGRGQIHVLALTSLTTIVAALVNFSFVFTGIDPVRVSQPLCSPEAAAACDAHTTNAFCTIPRDSWDWRDRCERNIAAALSFSLPIRES